MSIKHNNLPRRVFLLNSAKAISSIMLASSSIGYSAFSLATSSTASRQNYTPQYFTQLEWAFLQAACKQLIPSDTQGAGATEAGVPEFIDRQMLLPYGKGELWYMHGPFYPDAPPELGYQLRYSPREIYRISIANINEYCQQQYQKNFHEQSEKEQITLLEQLEQNAISLAKVPAKTFFQYLLDNTKEGFFSDPQYGGNQSLIGWKMINFPGARADFTDWIGQYNQPYPFPPVSITGVRG